MATWRAENSMLTMQGVEILNKLKAGIGSITVTRVVAGSDRVSESQLYLQTSISGNQKNMTISSKVTDETGSEISVYISNEEFTEAFDINQLGIYVTHPDYPGEVLYHISQCDAEDFDTIPSASETPVTQGYSIYMEHGNSDAITLIVDPQGFVTKDEFENLVNQLGDSNHLKESKIIYVSSTTGNNDTGDGSESAPFSSIQKAINSIPPNLSGYTVDIYVGEGNYSYFWLYNKYNGRINIKRNPSLPSSVLPVITGGSGIESCGCRVFLVNLKFVATSDVTRALTITATDEIGIQFCTFDGIGTAEGIRLLSGFVSCGVTYCVFENCVSCVNTSHDTGVGGMCSLSVYTCTGVNNVDGFKNSFAGIVVYGTTKESLGCQNLFYTGATAGPTYINGTLYTPVTPSQLVE